MSEFYHSGMSFLLFDAAKIRDFIELFCKILKMRKTKLSLPKIKEKV